MLLFFVTALISAGHSDSAQTSQQLFTQEPINISGKEFTVNSSSEDYPGAITGLQPTTCSIKYCKFLNCVDNGHTTQSFAGIALMLGSSTDATIDSCVFNGTTGGSLGMVCDGSNNVVISNCHFTSNTATTTTTCGIISDGSAVVVTMKKCLWKACSSRASATVGAAIAAQPTAPGLTLNWEDCDIFGCTLAPSQGFEGAGGFGIVAGSISATLTAKNICFANNTGQNVSDIYLSVGTSFNGTITNSQSTSEKPRHNDDHGVIDLPDGECQKVDPEWPSEPKEPSASRPKAAAAPLWVLLMAIAPLLALFA